MKKQSYIISLVNPCNEDWENMSANEKGRHCASCNKTVIDFSLYTDKQLIEFFKNAKDSVCGHIPKYQLERVMTVQQPNRFAFWRKLALGTVIASWFGLTEKADAQQKFTPHPVRQVDITKQNEKRIADSLQHCMTFSFYDAKTSQPIPYVYGTINSVISFTGDSSNHVKVMIPDSLAGKKALFYFYTDGYSGKSVTVDIGKLPAKKKIYLNQEIRHVMYNGGLGFREVNH